jgi:hypothetical protein
MSLTLFMNYTVEVARALLLRFLIYLQNPCIYSKKL